jgi:hypothetical protein
MRPKLSLEIRKFGRTFFTKHLMFTVFESDELQRKMTYFNS